MWPRASLDDLCEINVGRTPARANADFWGVGEPWLSIADMNQGRTITRTKEQITTAGANKGRQVAPGTVLLSFKLSIGKVARAGIPLFTNEAIAALPIKRTDLLDEEFLARALEHADLSGSSNRAAMGATLNKMKLKQVQIPLPPLPEQRRIAAILDHADALRAKRRQVLTHLDSLTQAIFLSMFGNPVTNEFGWRLERLSDLGTLDRGISKHRPRNDPALLGGKHPLIQTGDVANSGGHVTRYNSTYSDFGLRQSRMWPAGTLCITIAANIAKTGILRFDACFPDSIVGFTSDPKTTAFVQVWLGFLRETLEASAPQSAQKNINLATLRNLEVPSPDQSLLDEFAARISVITDQTSQVRLALAADDELFASLQARAFRGEL